ncbi:hypothetical protein CEUSTIGMA_g918.t1 [Chlamydomonas eustigma]|uniref:Uncharacterized protein n=1 Tax=Chlamydomonas eustigma TaxID=1157962 RepID=A0A250WRY5_9CHLO|nr:hypothetical protein CEUSTIGMA_g918.t1 [Chlamydomonas eustigma]|eukprot:GAX73466.1 hypothetical protein CEUSTIGMA_g918.t1 [Chlamydomonas eustigma]
MPSFRCTVNRRKGVPSKLHNVAVAVGVAFFASLTSFCSSLSNDYCELSYSWSNSSGLACPPCRSFNDVCKPVDNYWSNENVCITPIMLESPGVLQPCGAIEESLLLSVNGSIAGKLFVFQTADMMLYVTFQMSCPYLLRSSLQTSSAQYSSSLYVWSSTNNEEDPQYVDVYPLPGSYTCATYAVNLRQVCNPATSQFSFAPLAVSNAGCTCFPGSSPCPPSDLTTLPKFFITPILYSAPVNTECTDITSVAQGGGYEQFRPSTLDGTGTFSWSPQSCSPPLSPPALYPPHSPPSPDILPVLKPIDFGQLAPPWPPPRPAPLSSTLPISPRSTLPPFTIPPPTESSVTPSNLFIPAGPASVVPPQFSPVNQDNASSPAPDIVLPSNQPSSLLLNTSAVTVGMQGSPSASGAGQLPTAAIAGISAAAGVLVTALLILALAAFYYHRKLKSSSSSSSSNDGGPAQSPPPQEGVTGSSSPDGGDGRSTESPHYAADKLASSLAFYALETTSRLSSGSAASAVTIVTDGEFEASMTRPRSRRMYLNHGDVKISTTSPGYNSFRLGVYDQGTGGAKRETNKQQQQLGLESWQAWHASLPPSLRNGSTPHSGQLSSVKHAVYQDPAVMLDLSPPSFSLSLSTQGRSSDANAASKIMKIEALQHYTMSGFAPGHLAGGDAPQSSSIGLGSRSARSSFTRLDQLDAAPEWQALESSYSAPHFGDISIETVPEVLAAVQSNGILASSHQLASPPIVPLHSGAGVPQAYSSQASKPVRDRMDASAQILSPACGKGDQRPGSDYASSVISPEMSTAGGSATMALSSGYSQLVRGGSTSSSSASSLLISVSLNPTTSAAAAAEEEGVLCKSPLMCRAANEPELTGESPFAALSAAMAVHVSMYGNRQQAEMELPGMPYLAARTLEGSPPIMSPSISLPSCQPPLQRGVQKAHPPTEMQWQAKSPSSPSSATTRKSIAHRHSGAGGAAVVPPSSWNNRTNGAMGAVSFSPVSGGKATPVMLEMPTPANPQGQAASQYSSGSTGPSSPNPSLQFHSSHEFSPRSSSSLQHLVQAAGPAAGDVTAAASAAAAAVVCGEEEYNPVRGIDEWHAMMAPL